MRIACSNAVILLEGSASAQPVVQMSSLLAGLHPKPCRVQPSPFLISHILSLLRALTPQIIWCGVVKKADNARRYIYRSLVTRTHHTFLGVSFLSQEEDAVYSWQTACV